MQAPLVISVSAPSGAGKDTILRAVMAARPNLAKPVTTTTRAPRDGEVHGVHYYFHGYQEYPNHLASRNASFLTFMQSGGFVEHNKFGEAYYGLSYEALEAVRAAGKFPVVILDPNGAEALSAAVPTHRMFIRVPREVLVERIIRERPAHEVEARIALIEDVLEDGIAYDSIIDNLPGEHGLDQAVRDALAVIDTIAPQPRVGAIRR